MYAAVISVPLAPDRLEEAHRAYEAEMLPIVQQLPGFRGLQVLADRATGNLLAIALYETEADAQAAGANAAVRQAQQHLGRFMTGTPAREVYEVTLQALAPAGADLCVEARPWLPRWGHFYCVGCLTSGARLGTPMKPTRSQAILGLGLLIARRVLAAQRRKRRLTCSACGRVSERDASFCDQCGGLLSYTQATVRLSPIDGLSIRLVNYARFELPRLYIRAVTCARFRLQGGWTNPLGMTHVPSLLILLILPLSLTASCLLFTGVWSDYDLARQHDLVRQAALAPPTPVPPPDPPAALLSGVRQNLADRLQIRIDDVSVLKAEFTGWDDSGLGCPAPGEGELAGVGVMPGYRLRLEAQGNSYDYHTDMGIGDIDSAVYSVVLCENGQPVKKHADDRFVKQILDLDGRLLGDGATRGASVDRLAAARGWAKIERSNGVVTNDRYWPPLRLEDVDDPFGHARTRREGTPADRTNLDTGLLYTRRMGRCQAWVGYPDAGTFWTAIIGHTVHHEQQWSYGEKSLEGAWVLGEAKLAMLVAAGTCA